MALLEAIVVGSIVGFRHSFEPDHVAAVATLVDDGDARAGLVGTSWGVGHAIPIFVLGALFLALGTQLPPGVTTLFEALAGLVLVFLGARLLSALVGVTKHEHGPRARPPLDRFTLTRTDPQPPER